MTIKKVATIVIVAIATTATAGCGEPPTAEERAKRAVELCRGHDGVVAFDDEIVVCADQTSHVSE
jgi:hypothetical protein